MKGKETSEEGEFSKASGTEGRRYSSNDRRAAAGQHHKLEAESDRGNLHFGNMGIAEGGQHSTRMEFTREGEHGATKIYIGITIPVEDPKPGQSNTELVGRKRARASESNSFNISDKSVGTSTFQTGDKEGMSPI